ncbi:HEAT repeat domain-containing protein [Streptomyces sp. NPDC102270]|uniref:HEAT repeat domain-containing protein n=1 Tax=Streptomyces sp. NPDC102270 TaxID=3366150 RepID=UPI0038148AED
MSKEFNDHLTSGLSQANEPARRRESSTQLRNFGFARRHSLEKRGTLMHAASRKLSEGGLENLHNALQDNDETVRLNAIIGAGDLGDESTVPHLEMVCNGADANSRMAAIISIGDIGGRRGASFLAGIAKDSDEPEEMRFAALTEIEELVAKSITSGPDRRFDPAPMPPGEPSSPDEPEDVTRVRLQLIEDMRSIESDGSADEHLRLKAADIRSYLESGVA